MTSALAQELPHALPRDVSGTFLPGERVLLAAKPSPVSIILRRPGAFAAVIVGTALLFSLAQYGWLPLTPLGVLVLGLVALALVAFWGHLDWSMRDYVLTDRRVVSSSGVIRRLTVDSPLGVIQQVVIYRSLRERLFALGTIGFSTPADAGAPSVVWSMVGRPDVLVAQVRLAIARAVGLEPLGVACASASVRAQQSGMLPPHPPDSRQRASLAVIGLAGGIGAGKSTVAGILAKLGCLVVDSDARAKAALDRPDIRDQLVAWWGEKVLQRDPVGGGGGPGGARRIDRAEVARVIFADPEQRKRLESLVHPIVRQDRATAIREGAAAGARAVIIDAPLLYEAGLDAECDVVIFVDAPRGVRLERVRSNRGWSAAELDRREGAQLPLQSKRAKADFVVQNEDRMPDLESRVANVLEEVLTRPRSARSRG